ncbi:MAG: glycoside hydrolase family 3 C-terminal domain-containing protein, partial [Christensenellaceae bacterium]
MMCAYNKINGEYCCENAWLLSDVLRREWGFDGVVTSDWGATHDRVKGVAAGLDLEMPGDTAICRKWIVDAVKDGTLNEEDLNQAAANVLRLVQRYENVPCGRAVDWQAHNALAAEIAEDCAVLLKNDGALPLLGGGKLLVVGDLFEKMRYQGAGSSMINPTVLTTPKTAFDQREVKYRFCRGYAENALSPDEKLIAEAVAAVNDTDIVLIFAGLTDYVESEGCDRENMRLPENQLALIDALVDTGKKIVVVLYGGSPMELPFADEVNAILNLYLPGQNGGTATYDLLFGVKSPCGKLAETWGKEYADVPFGKDFSRTVNEIYRESVFVGYRYYLTAQKAVRYPFGYGLSYTKFDYRDMQVEECDEAYRVSCEIANIGQCDGAEVVQLYVKAPQGVFKPIKELKGFQKIYLKAGESKRAEITLQKSDLRYWNVKQNGWVLEGGAYELQLCSDCQTALLSRTVTLNGDGVDDPYASEVCAAYSEGDLKISDSLFEKMSGLKIPPLPPKKPIRLESRFSDLRSASPMGRILYHAVLSVAAKDMKRAKKLPEGAERDNKIKGAIFLKRILESNSIITMSMSGGKSFPYHFAEGFVHFANGHLLKGIKCFCTPI